ECWFAFGIRRGAGWECWGVRRSGRGRRRRATINRCALSNNLRLGARTIRTVSARQRQVDHSGELFGRLTLLDALDVCDKGNKIPALVAGCEVSPLARSIVDAETTRPV